MPWPATRPEVRDGLVAWADARVDRAMTSPAPRPALASRAGETRIVAFLVDVLGSASRPAAGPRRSSALAVLGCPEARSVIRRCLRSTDADVRAQAIETLDSLGDRRLGRADRPAASRMDLDGRRRRPARRRAWTACGMMTIRGSGRLADRVAGDGGAMARPGRESRRDRDGCSQLRRVPLFERLDPEDLQRVAAVADGARRSRRTRSSCARARSATSCS